MITPEFAALVAVNLHDEGYTVETVADGEIGLASATHAAVTIEPI